MKKPHLPTAAELALLVVLLVQRYAKERSKEISRFRLARGSLRRLAIRKRLRDALVDDWQDIMALEHGWLVFVDSEDFVLIQVESAKTWTKIATKRCDDLITRLRAGDATAIQDADNEIEPTPEPDEGEDD
jgi:hypothetical protein